MKKRWLWAVAGALVVIVAATGGGYLYRRPHPPKTRFAAAPVTKGTISESLSMTGNLAPTDEWDLNFKLDGTVSAVRRPGRSVGGRGRGAGDGRRETAAGRAGPV